MNDTLEITTLGGLEIRVEGEPVTGFYSRKVEALLVYLVSTGRPQSRDVLADLLWDDVTQSRAMGNLRVVLHNLREKLGPYVEITRTTVAMNPDNSTLFDAAELESGLASSSVEQIADALNLYEGDFLAGFYVRDCPRFEEWQLVEQERLRGAVMGALDGLVDHYLERGAHDLALENARRLLELDPLLEQAHRQVMRCLAYLGQRSAALAHYEVCRRILDEELGVEPEAETTALYEAILAGEVTIIEVGQPPPHNLPTPATPFIGRESELAELDALLSDPDARLVTVVGPGGAGKTRMFFKPACSTKAFPTALKFQSVDESLTSSTFLSDFPRVAKCATSPSDNMPDKPTAIASLPLNVSPNDLLAPCNFCKIIAALGRFSGS